MHPACCHLLPIWHPESIGSALISMESGPLLRPDINSGAAHLPDCLDIRMRRYRYLDQVIEISIFIAFANAQFATAQF